MKNLYIPLVLLSFLMLCCGKKSETCELDPGILEVDLDVKITRLEDEFFGAESAQDYHFLLEKYPDFAESYLQQSLYFSPDSLAANLLEIHQDSALRVLYDSVKIEFSNVSELENELETVFKAIKYYFPSTKFGENNPPDQGR